ncbi:hypothetical protein MACH08_19880 [Oceanobacillus kimchii]|uniref:Uncharacterized protein n=1 Tax=Oceanobacillus kimchii TaxID=746691 RepID=A0ABQ5TH49_9BACI|nr:hypothetical protein MACH08_19880 [Oceanobacillus kimchii]
MEVSLIRINLELIDGSLIKDCYVYMGKARNGSTPLTCTDEIEKLLEKVGYVTITHNILDPAIIHTSVIKGLAK